MQNQQGAEVAFDRTHTRLWFSNNTVLLFGEVPEVECSHNVSYIKQGPPHACDNWVIVAASKRSVWVGDYCSFRFAELTRVGMLFWIVKATV
jgi:hypothetical protein